MNLAVARLALGKKLAARFAGAWSAKRARHDEFARLFAEIQSSSTALTETVAEIEARFLEISTTVEATTKTGRELVELGEALIALALGQGGGQICIETTAEHIWRSIKFVEDSIRESDDLIGQLSSTHEQLNQSLSAEQDLGRTLAPLTFVQALFRVESARLAPEVQTMFQALVGEIERVRTNVESEFRAKFQLIRDIREILSRAIAQLTLRAVGAKKSVADLRLHLTESLDRMQASYERNRDRDTRLSGVSRAVANETGRVVMSLQFCDTFTQKLQHTQKILTEMHATGSSLPTGPDEACRALRFLQQSGLICEAQLAAMQAEFIQSGETLRTGILGIVRQMSALDDDCLALRDLDSVTTGVDGAVQILLDSIADVQRLVSDAANFAMESHQTIQPISGKTTNFTRFISNLSFEIQLIGLNAEIQATHVGRGTGLEVLSAQTSAISRETSALSTKLAVNLDDLTAGLGRIVTAFEDIRERSVAFNRTLAVEAAADNAMLHDYRDSSLGVLLKIGELLPQLQAETKTALAQADFVEIANQPLARLETAVAQITAAASAAADRSGLKVETAGLTDHFLKFYTMTAEGDVHRKALGQVAPMLAAPAPLTGEIDLFADVPSVQATPPSGDIELFGFDDPVPAPVPVSASEKTAPPVPAESNIDLWLDEPTALPTEPNQSTPKADQRSAA